MIYTSGLIFASVCVFALVLGTGFFRLTRDITFFNEKNTDNHKQIYAASQADKWRFPSDMHKFGGGKTRMKDVVVLLLALMQRLMGDKKGDQPLVSLCALGNTISAVLIYMISFSYWGLGSALLIFILYITSVWPWQISLMGGHICIGQLLFLLSVYYLQLTEALSPYWVAGLFGMAGAVFCWSQFSSASTRKFVPLFLGAFFYSQRSHLSATLASVNGWGAYLMSYASPVILGFSILSLSLLLARIGYKYVIEAMYFERAPSWLTGFIKNRQENSLEYYLKKAGRLLKAVTAGSFILFFYVFAYLIILGSSSFYTAQVPVAIGIFAAGTLLIAPDIVSNLKGYLYYSNIGKEYNHFRIYEEYFAKIGKPIKKDMRGAGLRWIIKYFSRIATFQFAGYIACLIFLVLASTSGLLGKDKIWGTAGIIFLSTTPVMWAEITRAPQIGRSYFPGFYGMLILVAYTIARIQREVLFGPEKAVFWSFAGGAVLLSAVWNFGVFFRDVFPARMAAARLAKTLKRLGIKRFHTYKTSYNEAFTYAMNEKDLASFEIIHINSLNDIKEEENGVVVVPGVSSKALNMVGVEEGLANRDFREDEFLNELIDTHKIWHCSIACFKTFGTSRIWVHEEEPSSYRDLILGEIDDEDRWRGHGWILDMQKVKPIIAEMYGRDK